ASARSPEMRSRVRLRPRTARGGLNGTRERRAESEPRVTAIPSASAPSAGIPEYVRALERRGKGVSALGKRSDVVWHSPGIHFRVRSCPERSGEGTTALGNGRDPRANPAPLRQQTQPLEVLREAGAVGGGDPGHAGGGVVVDRRAAAGED